MVAIAQTLREKIQGIGAMAAPASTVWWLRKVMRLHDNPALLAALPGAAAVHPLFILDPQLATPAGVGGTRMRFLLESPAITGTTLLVDGGQHLAPQTRDVMFLVREGVPKAP
jgi:hypothetical protein